MGMGFETRFSAVLGVVFLSWAIGAGAQEPAPAERASKTYTNFDELVDPKSPAAAELRAMGLVVERSAKFKHIIQCPWVRDGELEPLGLSSGVENVGIRSIKLDPPKGIEVVYENGIKDVAKLDSDHKKFNVTTLAADGTKRGDTSADLFKDEECTYDVTQKATYARGHKFPGFTALQYSGLSNYASLQRQGVCKKVDMKCGFTTLAETSDLYVRVMGVAAGEPVRSWQDFPARVETAKKLMGCEFKLGCSLSGGKGTSAASLADGGKLGLRLGDAFVPATLPPVAGVAAKQTILGILEEIPRLREVCSVSCQFRRVGADVEVTFNGEKSRFPAGDAFRVPASSCSEGDVAQAPADGKASDSKRVDDDSPTITDQGQGPASKPKGSRKRSRRAN